MDIYYFINSKDVRNYLKKIGYTFSPLEKAFLVYHSYDKPLQKKMQAWEEIIDTTPDFSLEKKYSSGAKERIGFHSILSSYMDLQRQKLNFLYDGSGYVYYYSTFECSYDGLMSWKDNKGIFFSDYASCANYCKKYERPKIEVAKIRISKCKLNPSLDEKIENTIVITAVLTKNLDILEIQPSLAYYESENMVDIEYPFYGMCFDFPTPFRCGDIVTTHEDREINNIPFVLSHISTWTSKEKLSKGYYMHDCQLEKECTEDEESKNNTSIEVLGYLTNQEKIYYANLLIFPTDLEYYTDTLDGYNAQLIPFSLYKKGEIDYKRLLDSCYSIRKKEMGNNAQAEKSILYNGAVSFNWEVLSEMVAIPVVKVQRE